MFIISSYNFKLINNPTTYNIVFQRRKRSALPPNYSDVELLALESNVIEEKEKREGRQQQFGVPKKNGKRRRERTTRFGQFTCLISLVWDKRFYSA